MNQEPRQRSCLGKRQAKMTTMKHSAYGDLFETDVLVLTDILERVRGMCGRLWFKFRPCKSLHVTQLCFNTVRNFDSDATFKLTCVELDLYAHNMYEMTETGSREGTARTTCSDCRSKSYVCVGGKVLIYICMHHISLFLSLSLSIRSPFPITHLSLKNYILEL